MFQGSNRQKLIKSLVILLGIILLVAIITFFHDRNSMTLSEYEKQNASGTSVSETLAHTAPDK